MAGLLKSMEIFRSGFDSLKSAADIAIGISKLHTMAEVQAKAIELHQVILSAQSEALSAQTTQFTMLNRIGELEKELANIKAWEAEKQNYDLTELASGVFAYALKEEASPSEPAHMICAKCYEDRHKSILQKETRDPGAVDVLICHRCDAEFYINGVWEPAHSARRTGKSKR